MNDDPRRAALMAKRTQLENQVVPRVENNAERLTKHLPEKLTAESARTETEESLIAIAVQFPEVVDSMTSIVTSNDFIDPILAKIWQLLTDIKESGDGVNRAEVLSKCHARGYIDEAGGKEAFRRIIDRQITSQSAKFYATEVVRFAELRRIEFTVGYIRELLKDVDADPIKILQAFQARTEGLGKSKDAGFFRMSDIVDEVMAHQELPESQQIKPISTGIPAIDSVIGGFGPGKLYLLGGRLRKGKSALAGNFASSAVEQGKSVWFVSMEMTNQELAERTIAYSLQLNLSRFKTKLSDSEVGSIRSWNDSQRDKNFWVTDKCRESIRSISAKVKLHKSLEGLDLLIIDNLSLMKPESSQEPLERQLKHITESLKSMAKELDIAILLLCQLDNKAEKEKADISSWAACKSIPNDADVTMILSTSETTINEVRESALTIHKNRSGVGNVEIDLDFIGKFQEFRERQGR